MKHYTWFSVGALVITILVFTPLLAFYHSTLVNQPNEISALDLNFSDNGTVSLGATLSAADDTLPIADVAEFPADNAHGTVVLIPQNHRYPGTEINDPKNDSAEEAQSQIYDIEKYLHEQQGIDFVMIEGELYGAVPAQTIDKEKNLIAIRNDLVAGTDSLKSEMDGNPYLGLMGASVAMEAESVVDYVDRTIILKGSAYKLAAEGEDLALYGTEDPQTQAECAAIVRDYIYQQDQLAACSTQPTYAGVGSVDNANISDRLKAAYEVLKKSLTGGQVSAAAPDPAASGITGANLSHLFSIADLGGLLGGHGVQLDAFQNQLKTLLATVQPGDQGSLTQAVGSLIDTVGRLIDWQNETEAVASTAPSRSDNPYASITDPAELKQMISDTEDKIESEVVERRNRETAEFYDQASLEKGEDIGILQYGAGHEDGLVEELNAQGLNVVVVKPDEVKRRELSGEDE